MRNGLELASGGGSAITGVDGRRVWVRSMTLMLPLAIAAATFVNKSADMAPPCAPATPDAVSCVKRLSADENPRATISISWRRPQGYNLRGGAQSRPRHCR